MTGQNNSDKQAFAALMASKLCHDLISPVSALGNALELLEMEDDPDMRDAALALLKDGAGQAARRLQFYRLAFGAAGGAFEIDGRDVARRAADYVQDAKPDLDWRVPSGPLSLERTKILLNLTALLAESLPRGGVVTVAADGNGYQLKGAGPMVRLPDEFVEVLEGLRPAEGAREASLGLIRLLLGAEEMSITIKQGEEELSVWISAG